MHHYHPSAMTHHAHPQPHITPTITPDRREKLKRDLVRVSCESLDSLVGALGPGGGGGGSPTGAAAAAARGGKKQSPSGGTQGTAAAEERKRAAVRAAAAAYAPFSVGDVDYDALCEKARATAGGGAQAAASSSSGAGGGGGDAPRRVPGRPPGPPPSAPAPAPAPIPPPTENAHPWSRDDDHRLLLGVSACGVGRWAEIREEFELVYNSSQMNQRFTLLTRRRAAHVRRVKVAADRGKKGSGRAAAAEEDEEDEEEEEEEDPVREKVGAWCAWISLTNPPLSVRHSLSLIPMVGEWVLGVPGNRWGACVQTRLTSGAFSAFLSAPFPAPPPGSFPHQPTTLSLRLSRSLIPPPGSPPWPLPHPPTPCASPSPTHPSRCLSLSLSLNHPTRI